MAMQYAYTRGADPVYKCEHCGFESIDSRTTCCEDEEAPKMVYNRRQGADPIYKCRFCGVEGLTGSDVYCNC